MSIVLPISPGTGFTSRIPSRRRSSDNEVEVVVVSDHHRLASYSGFSMPEDNIDAYKAHVSDAAALVTSDALTPAQKEEFLTAFNKVTKGDITSETLDKVHVEEAINKYCRRKSVDELKHLLKKVRKKLEKLEEAKRPEGAGGPEDDQPVHPFMRYRISEKSTDSEYIYTKELDRPNVKICVWNGDMEELVNLPLKDLPHNGSLKSQMGDVCKYMASDDVSPEHRKALAAAMNAVLGDKLKRPLAPQDLSGATTYLIEGLKERYPDRTDKMEAFLSSLESKMGDDYPLKNFAPRRQKEQNEMRIRMVQEYAQGKHIVLHKDELKSIPGMSKEELREFLHDINERGLDFVESTGHWEKAMNGLQHQNALLRSPDEFLEKIYKKTRFQDEKVNEIVARHIDDLTYYLKRYPDITFHYVIGNHERLDFFIGAIKDLKKDFKNLEVHEDYVKIGDGLFIHGDQQMNPKKYKTSGPDMYDEPLAEMNRSFMMQVVHDHLNKRIPRHVGEILHRAEQCARNIVLYFDEKALKDRETDPKAAHVLDGITHVFMGHTHYPFTNIKIIDGYTADMKHVTYCAHPGESLRGNPLLTPGAGREFYLHNTGAALAPYKTLNRGAFNPLRVTLGMPPEMPKTQESGNGHPTEDAHQYLAGCTIRRVEQINQPELQRA